MYGIGGLQPFVEQNLDGHQAELAADARHLSTGLRINGAQDDPSGLAVAESLQAQVTGADIGTASLREAHDALNTAEGGLQTVSDILQRLRSLLVEGNSDFNSASDLADLDDEIRALLHELDTIANKTEYNGQPLLDGSLDTSPPVPASIQPATSPPDPATGVQRTTLANGSPLLSNIVLGPDAIDAYFLVTVTACTATTASLQFEVNSADPAFGPQENEPGSVAAGTNTSFSWVYPDPTPDNKTLLSTITIGPISPADVGVSQAFRIVAAKAGGTGQAITVNVGRGEGDVLAISAPGVSAAQLGIANLQTTPREETDDVNVFQASSPRFDILQGLYLVDDAIQTVGAARAQLGAQTVAVQEATQNDQVYSVNAQASESSVRDADVGAETVAYTEATIDVQIGDTVVADLNSADHLVSTLVDSSAAGSSAGINVQA